MVQNNVIYQNIFLWYSDIVQLYYLMNLYLDIFSLAIFMIFSWFLRRFLGILQNLLISLTYISIYDLSFSIPNTDTYYLLH